MEEKSDDVRRALTGVTVKPLSEKKIRREDMYEEKSPKIAVLQFSGRGRGETMANRQRPVSDRSECRRYVLFRWKAESFQA